VRILWISDSPDSPSGFGMVTREVCSRLARRGHEVEILGWQTRAATVRWEGIPVRPVRFDAFGSDVLLGYLMRFQPDFVITLADIWWMSFMTDPPVQRFLDQSGARWVLYFPLDGAAPDGELPAGWVRMLETADLPVAMSTFGCEVSTRCGVESAYVPHGCDTELFRPPADKDAAKARLGYEGRFVILSDARNQPRKLLPRLLDIASAVAPGRSDVVVHLHADPEDSAAASELYHYRLLEDRRTLGLEERVRLTADFRMLSARGLPLPELAALYQAADVHLLTSWGEGFGLPTLQAASAGAVPMAVDYSASRELVAGHGVAVPVESSLVDEFGLRRCLLDRGAAVAAIEELIADGKALAERAARSREFALDYDWETVVERWDDVLSAAPARRRPSRSLSFEWVGGEIARSRSELPEPVAYAAGRAFAGLPDSAKVSFRMSERRFGEVAAEISAETFLEGTYVSVPVRLAPFFAGAPRARIGHILVSPADLELVAALRAIFPGVAVSVPKPPEDPAGERFLTREELVPALPHYTLVVDYAGQAAPGVDVACAALGVPFAGPSRWWGPISGDRLRQLRRLLTDQGFSEARRLEAAATAQAVFGAQPIEEIRALALAGQPEPKDPREESPPPQIETLIVRPQAGAPPTAKEEIAEFAAGHGGLVLMVTAGDALVLALPHEAKERIEGHPLVGFVGGINLDEEASGARGLKRIFAANAARQLEDRRLAQPSEFG